MSTVYNILLVIHIVAVAMWLGSNVVMGVGANRSLGASAEVNIWWAETQGVLARVIKNAAFALLFATGIGMIIASDDAIKFSAPFVSFGFLAVIVGGALAGMVFSPGTRKLAEAHRNGDTAAAKAQADKMGMVGMGESLLVVVTILYMVFKWGGFGGS